MTFLCRRTISPCKDPSTRFFSPGYFFTIHFMKPDRFKNFGSVLGWPAWLRVVAVVPALVLLWLAVAWAQLEAAPW